MLQPFNRFMSLQENPCILIVALFDVHVTIQNQQNKFIRISQPIPLHCVGGISRQIVGNKEPRGARGQGSKRFDRISITCRVSSVLYRKTIYSRIQKVAIWGMVFQNGDPQIYVFRVKPYLQCIETMEIYLKCRACFTFNRISESRLQVQP